MHIVLSFTLFLFFYFLILNELISMINIVNADINAIEYEMELLKQYSYLYSISTWVFNLHWCTGTLLTDVYIFSRWLYQFIFTFFIGNLCYNHNMWAITMYIVFTIVKLKILFINSSWKSNITIVLIRTYRFYIPR